MFNAKSEKEYLEFFVNHMNSNIEKNCNDVDFEKFMKEGNVDAIRDSVKKIQNNIIASVPAGLPVPKASLYVSPVGADAIEIITITLSNRVTSDKKFKYTTSITTYNSKEAVISFMTSVYTELFVDILIDENLEDVNELLANVAKDAGLSYVPKIVSPLGNDSKKIAYMADDEIDFVADANRVFDLDNILALRKEPDEEAGITEEGIQSAYQQLVEDLGQSQTPEELVANHGGLLIGFIANVSKRVKPMTYIKKVVSKDATKLRGEKDSIAYYNDGKVFAIVVRRDGHFETLLSPFDQETLKKVDFDVVKAIA